MSTQSQPIIPVTMPFDGSRNYGNDHGRNYHHDIIASVERQGLSTTSAVDRQAQSTLASLERQGMSTNSTIIGGDRDIISKVSEGDKDLLAAINREGVATAFSINSQANNQSTRDHANMIETRQAVERNSDKVSTQSAAQSIAELLAIQNTATATQLGVQNTSTATQLGVQNTATSIGNIVRDSYASTAATIAGLSVQAERINGLNVVESKNIQVNQGRDLGAIQLLAAQNFSTLQLQASESKGFLTNHVTSTSNEGVLKTVESMNKVMEKLAECCCENKLLHKDTQQLISANEASSLRTALAQAQQEALIAKLTSK